MPTARSRWVPKLAWSIRQGDARLTGVSQRHEYEIAFGGDYKLAPGVQLVGEYMYDAPSPGWLRLQPPATLGIGGPLPATPRPRRFLFATVLTW